MLCAWIAARRKELSTKLGLWLGSLSVMLPQLAAQLQAVNQQAADYVSLAGGIVGCLLVIYREGK